MNFDYSLAAYRARWDADERRRQAQRDRSRAAQPKRKDNLKGHRR